MNIKDFVMARSMFGGSSGGGSSGSSGAVDKKDVCFYDYDGTLLYSYTVEEAAALEELPPLPTQTGLVCQEWNWSLEDIKAHNRAVDVGATYITDDGKTRIYINIGHDYGIEISLYIRLSGGTVLIDWGDGSTPDSINQSGQSWSHQYNASGEYMISIEAIGDAVKATVGRSSYGILNSAYKSTVKKIEFGKVTPGESLPYGQYDCLTHIVFPNTVTDIGNFYGCVSLTAIVIPKSLTTLLSFENCSSLTTVCMPNGVATIVDYGFKNCYALANITIPDSVTRISYAAFQYCCSLKKICIPRNVNTIGNSTFERCYSLEQVIILNGVTYLPNSIFSRCSKLNNLVLPNGITEFGNEGFLYCESLRNVIIPDSVQKLGNSLFDYCNNLGDYIAIPKSVHTIGYGVFSNCRSVHCYDFRNHTTVPSLGGSNTFSNETSYRDFIILVPVTLYDEWIAATNWSNYASNIVAV